MKTKIIGFLLALFISILAFSQKQSFKKFGEKEGLTQNYIYSLTQSPDGFLWVATAEGVFKYNGFNFTQTTTKQGLAENFVNTSYTDVTGTTWMGHNKGSISKITNNSISKVKTPSTNSKINQIIEDSKGRVLAVAQNFGIIEINNPAYPVYKIHNTQFYSLTQTPQGYFLGSSNGLHRVTLENNKIKRLNSPPKFKNLEIKNVVAHNSLLYVGTEDSGLYVMNTINQQITSLQGAIPATKIQCLLKDKANNVWVATDKGFAKISPQKSIQFFNQNNGFDFSNIKTIYEDNEGNIWIGTYGEGLYKLQDVFFDLFTPQQNFIDGNILSIYVDKDKSTWIGTDLGITHFVKKDSIVARGGYTVPIIISQARNTTTPIKTILRAKNDPYIWVGTAKGVYKMDPVSKNMYLFNNQSRLESGIINQLTQDRKNNIWIATTAGGAYKYDTESKKITKYTTRNGLPHNDVNQIFEDSKGNVWILTYGTGVTKIEQDTLLTIYKAKDGLGRHEIISIAEDSKANIWLGTLGDGLFKYDGKTFKNYTVESGIASNYCYTLNIDAQDNLWIGSKIGISKFNPNSNVSVVYNPLGYTTSNYDVTQNASCLFNKNDLYFGTRNGLLEYSASKFLESAAKPNVVIKELWIDDKERSLLDKIRLAYKRWDLKFVFEGITFKNPERLRYIYFLEGFDTKWSEPTAETEVTFSKLDFGTYVFKIKACNDNGSCSKEVISMPIIIATPIWTKWWFYALVGGGIILLIVVIVRIREIQFRKAKNILEDAVIERTKQLNIKNDELAETNQILKLQKNQLEALNKEVEDYTKVLESKNKDLDQFAYIVSHDLKAPLRGVATLSGFIKEDLGTAIPEKVLTNLDLMTNRVSRMEGLIEAILTYSKAGNDKQNKTKVNVGDLLNQIIADLNPESKHRFSLQPNFPEIMTEPTKLQQVFSNLISNSIKYNDKPEARIHLSFTHKTNDMYLFTVSDNGPGIASEHHDKIFEIFQTLKSKDDYESTGIGLAIVKKIVEEKGGRITVDSELGKGASFNFTWPAH